MIHRGHSVEPQHLSEYKTKKFEVYIPKKQDNRIRHFWFLYLVLSVLSFLPIFGFVASYLLFTFSKNRFFKIIPVVFSVAANGYLLYLRFYAEPEFKNLFYIMHQ
ncbi:hypothetical protein [Leptospira perolatii]|nr:hypothetical protein [Leptospira perolatii]